MEINDNQNKNKIPSSSKETLYSIAVPIIFQNLNLPFDVENDLNIFSKVFVTRNYVFLDLFIVLN